MFLIAETFLSTGVLDSFYWPPNDSGRPYIIIFCPSSFFRPFFLVPATFGCHHILEKMSPICKRTSKIWKSPARSVREAACQR